MHFMFCFRTLKLNKTYVRCLCSFEAVACRDVCMLLTYCYLLTYLLTYCCLVIYKVLLIYTVSQKADLVMFSDTSNSHGCHIKVIF